MKINCQRGGRPRGSAVGLANHRAVREYRRKISSQRKGIFLTIIGYLSNTPYLGMCRFRRVVWVLFQRTFQLVRLEALLEASKLTISYLKGLLVALCLFKLNCKQRLIKE